MAVQMANKAIELRRRGFSYSDISKELKVSRTSVSNWVKNVKLTESEKINLQKSLKAKVMRGRLNANIIIRSRKIFKDKNSYEKAEKEFIKYLKEPLFTTGLGLYCSRGLKKGNIFQFTSSDPAIMAILLKWLEKYLDFSRKKAKYRLFLDISHKDSGLKKFWSEKLDIPETVFQKDSYISKSKSHNAKDYKGSLAIIIPKMEVVRRVIAWQKSLIGYYN